METGNVHRPEKIVRAITGEGVSVEMRTISAIVV
jgi:hypothetical protein